MTKFIISQLLILVLTSPILAGSTSVQNCVPVKIDSQQVILPVQAIDSLNKKIERIETLLQKQHLQTVNTPTKENCLKENIGWLKDSANFIFFIVAIIGTGITFWFNRMSLFNPLRTEVLKKQFEIYTDLLDNITDSKIYSFGDINLLNLLKFLNRYVEFKNAIQNDEYYKKALEQRCDLLDIVDKNSGTLKGNQKTKPYYEETTDHNYRMLKVFIDSNTLSIWDKLDNVSSSPFVAKDVKDKVQELLDSVKANILTKLVPLIEAKINDIDKWYKVSKNEATSEINIGKSILDNLIVITYFWNEVNAKYKEEGINNTKCIIALKKSIAEQLKIHEILKK